jgi:DNA-binding MarR family transcriptional regulator
MVVILDELEGRGWAERQLSPDDRRARIITVTAAGKRKVAEAERVKERVQAEVLGELTEREGRALLSGLERLVEGRLSEPTDCAKPLRRRVPRA